jgi:plastocyanin
MRVLSTTYGIYLDGAGRIQPVSEELKMTYFRRQLLCLGLLVPAMTLAAEHEVFQKNKRFSLSEMTIKVGDTVSFPNSDPFFHNVFSLSPTRTFDLGSYPAGETRKVTFDNPGVVEVECAIHPHMKLRIDVQ